MPRKIKAIDIVTDATIVEPVIEEPERKEEQVVEPPKIDIETDKQEDTIKEVVAKVDAEPPKVENMKNEVVVEKPARKMITCPDCGKTMLEKNFRYQHINVCGKVKVPKTRAKPLEDVIKEKREKATQPEPKPEPVLLEVVKTVTQPVDYMELRRQYNNQLKEQKQQLVKRLISKAF